MIKIQTNKLNNSELPLINNKIKEFLVLIKHKINNKQVVYLETPYHQTIYRPHQVYLGQTILYSLQIYLEDYLVPQPQPLQQIIFHYFKILITNNKQQEVFLAKILIKILLELVYLEQHNKLNKQVYLEQHNKLNKEVYLETLYHML